MIIYYFVNFSYTVIKKRSVYTMTEFDNELGTILRKERESRRITQQQMADLLGCTKMAVSSLVINAVCHYNVSIM